MGLFRKKQAKPASSPAAAATPVVQVLNPKIATAKAVTATATLAVDKGSHRDRTSIRTKLLLMMLPATLVGLGIITLFASQAGKKALTDAAFNQLTSYRSAKKHQIEGHYREIREAFSVLGTAPGVVDAFRELKEAYSTLPKEPPAPERLAKLEKLYRDALLPALKDEKGKEPPLEEYLPTDPRALELQLLFKVESPFNDGDEIKLLNHPVQNPYTIAHAKHHGWLRSVVEKLRYHDLMMVDPETGAVFYSASKEFDFGPSMIEGPYARTKLGEMVRSVIAAQKRDDVRLTDYEFYPGSANKPSNFMVTPIYDGWKFSGVLIAQVSTDAIDEFMNNHRSWREQGLGETGSAYIASLDDGTMRSNAREMIEKPDEYIAKLRHSGAFAAASIDGMSRDKTTLLRYPVNKEPVLDAKKVSLEPLFCRVERAEMS